MPDPDTFVNPGAPPGAAWGMTFRIDSDNDSTTQVFSIENNGGGITRRQLIFLVEHDAGGAGEELLQIGEDGTITVYGDLNRVGAHHLENTASGEVARFESQSVLKAVVTGGGVAVFFGGLRLRRNTAATNPNAAGLAGQIGEVILWNNSATGNDELWACSSAAPVWNRATL